MSIEKLSEQLAGERNKFRRQVLMTKIADSMLRSAKPEKRKPPRREREPAPVPIGKWHKLGDLKQLMKQKRN
jgi:hypothetical protein